MKKADRQGWLAAFLRRQGKLEPRFTGIFLGSLAVTLALVIASGQFSSLFNFVLPSAYEVGKVAPRDVTVDRDVLYKDVEATRLRQEAVEKLVAPVFRINEEIGQSKLRQGWMPGNHFARITGKEQLATLRKEAGRLLLEGSGKVTLRRKA